MSLLDLPDEILEKIADFLDGFSLVSYSLCDQRLQRAALVRGDGLVKEWDTQRDISRTRPVGIHIQSLDLSNRFEISSALEGVILECPELRTLNVVNANLTFQQLTNILDNLEMLDVMSCSLSDVPPDSWQERSVLKAQRSIRKLFVEFTPASLNSLLYLARFLNRCKVIEFLHLNFVGRFDLPSLGTRNPFPARSPRWRTLQTMVGSFHLSSRSTFETAMHVFMDFSQPRPGQCLMRQHMQFVPFCWSSVENFTSGEVIVTRNINALKSQYRIRPEMTLNIMLRPYYRWPHDLVELDLSFVPYPFMEPDWEVLVGDSPKLRSIACHICSLPRGPDFSTLDPQGLAQHSYVIVTLERLQLTRLHLLVGWGKYSKAKCPRCEISSTCYVLGNLDRLRYLEEFVLVGVDPTPVLYESIANSRVKMMKLCLKKAPNLLGLYEMLLFCEGLRYFKFEAPDLPLHSLALWRALVKKTPLDQICLASDSVEQVDIEMVKSFLPDIMRAVEVFHLHADQHRALYDAILDYVKLVKRENPQRKVHLTGLGMPSLSCVRGDALVRPMPGRSLCCTSLLIGTMELPGWNIFEST